MSFIIELPASQEAALAARALSLGLSVTEYVEQMVDRDLEKGPEQTVSEMFREIWADMPQDVRAKLPADGAEQIDHYVYGVPKTNL